MWRRKEGRNHPIDRWLDHVPVTHGVTSEQVDQFWQKHSDGIRTIIARFVRNRDEFEEALQIARLAVFYALATYDPDRGVQLNTYFYSIIHRWLWDSIGFFRTLVTVPVNSLSDKNHRARVYQMPESYSKLDPNFMDYELAHLQGLTADYQRIVEQILHTERFDAVEEDDLCARFMQMCRFAGMEERLVGLMEWVVNHPDEGAYRYLQSIGLVSSNTGYYIGKVRRYLTFLCGSEETDLASIVQIGMTRLLEDYERYSYATFSKRTRKGVTDAKADCKGISATDTVSRRTGRRPSASNRTEPGETGNGPETSSESGECSKGYARRRASVRRL